MKKIITSIVVLFIGPLMAHGQSSFSVTTQGTATIIGGNTMSFTCVIFNPNYPSCSGSCGNGSINITQKIDSSSLPQGWSVTFCNPGGCYGPSVTSGSFTVKSRDSATALFTVHGGTDLAGAIHVRFQNAGTTTDGINYKITGNTIKKEEPISAGVVGNGIDPSLYLAQNYPNPFVKSTTIRYHTQQPNGTLIITDALGKQVEEYQTTGTDGEIVFDGQLPPGGYFYSLYSQGKSLTRRMSIVTQ